MTQTCQNKGLSTKNNHDPHCPTLDFTMDCKNDPSDCTALIFGATKSPHSNFWSECISSSFIVLLYQKIKVGGNSMILICLFWPFSLVY